MTQILRIFETEFCKKVAIGSIGMVFLSAFLAVDIFPVITNDSLAYLGHSDSLRDTGAIQFGYRQIGYPAFLAVVDRIATLFRMEPLLITVLIQRFIYLGALLFTLKLWKWRALPLVFLGLLPSLLVYTNLLLTEGLAIGLALWYAILLAWLIQIGMGMRKERLTQKIEVEKATFILLGLAAVFLALVTVRFHFITLFLGLIVVLYVFSSNGHPLKKVTWVVGCVTVTLLLSFLLVAAKENFDEYGDFSPSVRGERSQFWSTWQVTFGLTTENRGNLEIEDLFANGNPYEVMGRIDAIATYSEQKEVYGEEMTRLIDSSGTTWLAERTKSFLGAIQGGRIDDVRSIVVAASVSNFENIEKAMYRAVPIKNEGPQYFFERYNEGRRVFPVIVSPLAPFRSLPYFIGVFKWAMVLSILIQIYGLKDKRSRVVSLIGLITSLSAATLFGYFLMDNVRFVLPTMLCTIVFAVAAGQPFCMSRDSVLKNFEEC
jgi:hypothetical protein